MTLTTDAPSKATRGTSNANDRGSSTARRRRRAWIIETYQSDVPGFARCYRCGRLVFNPDDYANEECVTVLTAEGVYAARPLSIDRIIPGTSGGKYVHTNIRPSCPPCNSETGGGLWAKRKGKKR